MIRVVVAGAAGRMGKEVCRAVVEDPTLELVGAADPAVTPAARQEIEALAGVDVRPDVAGLLGEVAADVLVDFTQAHAVLGNARAAVDRGLDVVIGTTGLSPEEIDELSGIAEGSGKGIMLAPNFAIGAVAMMKLAERVAALFERVEIVELHHDQKADAPSGTAILTAELIGGRVKPKPLVEEEKVPHVRGGAVAGIPVHSVRLPGLVAHQEVIFGTRGQTLTIRHDSIDRTSFMPGVVLAIKEISKRPGLTYGLDKLLDI